MLKGIGVDIVNLKRIERIIGTKKERFLNKVFTDSEIEYIRGKNENPCTIGGIFATKEAVSKVLGTGIGKISLKEIEVFHNNLGKPHVKLYGKALFLMEEKGIASLYLSITHEREYAIAVVIGEGRLNYSRDIELKGMKDLKHMKNILPVRKEESHKGTYGRVGVVAGSTGMTGAAYFSSKASLRSGSGLVYTMTPKSLSNILSLKLTEAIIKPLEDNGKGHFILDSIQDIEEGIKDLDVIALGPGIGVDYERIRIVEEILNIFDKPMVLDADGLNCVSEKPEILIKREGETVITPHPGELSRLLKVSIGEIQRNRIEYCKKASQKYNVTTVLKGADTVVCSKSGEIYVNRTGNPGMATAGSGDLLTGVISSFIGQGIGVYESAILGTYIHGLAGDLAKNEKGEYGLIAEDILENIPYAIDLIYKN
ncbi:MAG TPA: NAD(P)H-hydrate dehydratase [Tissierellia bacterium]|nr:NAD(P)H-hydrate dehydratase [Tissierellia bacterium]